MSQSVSEIRSDIRQTKTELSQTVNELEHRLEEAKDWRLMAHRYPLHSLIVSVGLGFILGRGLEHVAAGTFRSLKHTARATLLAFAMAKVQDVLNRVE